MTAEIEIRSTNLLFLFCLLFLNACSTQENKSQIEVKEDVPEPNSIVAKNDTSFNENAQLDTVTVMVIPCSNGYDYNLKMGDLNPSIEKYLNADERIQLKPFPLKKMNGSGYFGVFDKRYCTDILKNTNVDFLVMTRMRGLELMTLDPDNRRWGYETKILNTSTMEQFIGISGTKLDSFELIGPDIKHKIDDLIGTILQSAEK